MSVFSEMLVLLQTRWQFFANLILEHLFISAISIFWAALLGLLLGIFISKYQKYAKIVLSMVNFIYTIPSISLLGLLLIFTGIGNTTAIIALTVYALLPMVRNTYTGLTTIDPAIIEAARGMGSTDLQILYKIKLPLAMPIIMSALRNMATMTIALAGIASFIGAGGLGVAVFRGITTNNTALTALGSLLTALLAIIVDSILGRLEKRINRRQRKTYSKARMLFLACFLLAFLSLSLMFLKEEDNIIKIGTKPMTEQYILGEMLKLLLEEELAVKVDLTMGVGGGTSHLHPATVKGEFDLYPEYTGTAWNTVLKEEGIYQEEFFAELNKAYQDNFDLFLISPYGFNNTYGLAVLAPLAERYKLKNFSDLALASNEIVFGAEADFYEREDGYQGLQKIYGFNFAKTVGLDIGLKYRAIQEGQIEAMNIFTTDGQLSSANLVVLQDNQGFYPSYKCINVVRKEAAEKYPKLIPTLLKLENKINDQQMAQLNHLVDSESREPREVAKEFLVSQGLLAEGN